MGVFLLIFSDYIDSKIQCYMLLVPNINTVGLHRNQPPNISLLLFVQPTPLQYTLNHHPPPPPGIIPTTPYIANRPIRPKHHPLRTKRIKYRIGPRLNPVNERGDIGFRGG